MPPAFGIGPPDAPPGYPGADCPPVADNGADIGEVNDDEVPEVCAPPPPPTVAVYTSPTLNVAQDILTPPAPPPPPPVLVPPGPGQVIFRPPPPPATIKYCIGYGGIVNPTTTLPTSDPYPNIVPDPTVMPMIYFSGYAVYEPELV
jgi:hypothetical protein